MMSYEEWNGKKQKQKRMKHEWSRSIQSEGG